jgi:hypothetical protein
VYQCRVVRFSMDTEGCNGIPRGYKSPTIALRCTGGQEREALRDFGHIRQSPRWEGLGGCVLSSLARRLCRALVCPVRRRLCVFSVQFNPDIALLQLPRGNHCAATSREWVTYNFSLFGERAYQPLDGSEGRCEISAQAFDDSDPVFWHPQLHRPCNTGGYA